VCLKGRDLSCRAPWYTSRTFMLTTLQTRDGHQPAQSAQDLVGQYALAQGILLK